MTWTRSEVEACLGEPKDNDIVAGWTRYWYKQERCSEWMMYRADGKVHAVQGYGAEPECRRVVNNCVSLATGKPMRDVRMIGGGGA